MSNNSWPPWEVKSSRLNLITLRETVERPSESGLSAEALGWMSRLLVVRSCGYLEKAVIECARGFVEEKSWGQVRSFGLTWLERSRNPKPAALVELLGRFDANLASEFQTFLSENGSRLETELHALVHLRNRIAHGENEGVNRARALSLSSAGDEVADWWISALNPLK